MLPVFGIPVKKHTFEVNEVKVYNVKSNAIIDMDGMTTVVLHNGTATVEKVLHTKKQVTMNCAGDNNCFLCNLAKWGK